MDRKGEGRRVITKEQGNRDFTERVSTDINRKRKREGVWNSTIYKVCT